MVVNSLDPNARGQGGEQYNYYPSFRKDVWRTLAQQGGARCQADEFPMGDLVEAKAGVQVIRLINWYANNQQGEHHFSGRQPVSI
jgi:hypothetical protein